MTAADRPELQQLLGPASGRYFAEGYREVRHDVHSIREFVPNTTTQFEAIAAVSYPPLWSVDRGGGTRTPHLSSVDAIVLPVLALQGSEHGDHQLERYWVREITLRAGSEPWWDLAEVPITMQLDASGSTLQLRAQSGNIRANIVLESAEQPGSPAASSSGVGASSYGEGFRRIHCETELTGFDAERNELSSTHSFSAAEHPQERICVGIESQHWPAVTIIDYLVTMGQQVQALVYLAEHTNREQMGNLWMRTMRISRSAPPAALPLSTHTSTSLIRRRLIKRSGATIHDLTVASRSHCAVTAEATVAYIEAV